jgi:hypothetical protein
MLSADSRSPWATGPAGAAMVIAWEPDLERLRVSDVENGDGPRVVPGRVIENAVESGGVDRRTFGEFIGPQGEIAAYAIGWRTDVHPPAGRVTVGIGAGNPEGGSFHALVEATDEAFVYELQDEPFEHVPEGGPDLTADQARAHEDLPFVWYVIDCVMENDPRAWWMRHWLNGTPVIVTPEVADQSEPVLLVANSTADDDPYWEMIGTTDAGTKGEIRHIYHLVEADPTLIEVMDLAG